MKRMAFVAGSLPVLLLTACGRGAGASKRDRLSRSGREGRSGPRLPQHLHQSLPAGRRRPRRRRPGRRRTGRGSGSRHAAGRARGGRSSSGRPRRRWRSPDAGSSRLVCAALQGVRQSLLARNAAAFVMGAPDQRRAHRPRHELRVGNGARDHRGNDEARSQPARHQVRRHQPRPRRPRSGRRGTAEALRRQGCDGRGRLGCDAAKAGDRCGRRPDARHHRRTGGHAS